MLKPLDGPFFSQITKFFSSASFPRPSNLFPQITAKSSTNFPFSYDQLSSSPMNSPSGYSNLFSNGHNPGHNYGQFSRSPVNNDQSSFPGSMNINRQMINRRHFSPSWEESFASSSMLEPIVAPDRRSSNGPVTFESRGPKPYFSIELGKDGWSSSVPLNGHFHSSQKNEQAKYNSDPKHNLYYIQPTHHHDHQKRSSRRKRSLRLTKPEYRYSMPHSNPSYSLFLRLFNNIRPNSLTFLTNPNKLVFGGPGGGHNFASASTLGATYLSPRFAPSLPNFSQSPYLGTTLRPVFTRQYDTSGYGHLPFASVNSPAFSPFTSGTSLGLGPHHSHYGLNLDSPFSSSSLSYEEDLKHRLLAQPKFLQTYDRPNLKSSSGFYENTDFNPLSIDLNELNEYESPPIYEAYSKKNSKEYDSNKEYYYRPVSLTKGNSKRPPKREKVPGHLQHSSSIEPQHSSRHHSIDDTSYSDASHSSSSSPSVHMDDEAYYKGDPNPNSYEHGPEGPAYMDKEREPEIYEDVGPSPARDPGRGPEGNVDDRDRSHDGYVNNPHHQSSYDYHSDGKKYDHYTSIDHYPEDGYDEGSSSGSMVRGHHDASIDYGALVPPYAKDLPSDPDSKSMGGVNYSTISQVYRPSLQVHQHRIHHVTSSPAQEYSGSNYYTPNEQHYVKHETGGNYESMNGKDSSPYQNGNINHNDANTYSNGPSMNQPITNQNNNNNFKLEVIEDDYDNSPQLPVRSNKDATKVKAESQNNEEQSKNYGYSPQSNIKYPYDYENTKIFINHGGGDHGRPYIGEAAYNEYPDSGYGDSDYANGKNYYPEPEQVNTPTTNQNINNNNNNDNTNNKNNANNNDDNKSGGNKNDKERDKVGQKKISPYDKKYHYNKPTITKITKEMKTSTPTMTEKPSSGQAPSSSYHSHHQDSYL
ncbi:uncharacterized protein DDB_G0283357-like [Tetranychus urticae]|nr:uncharacterized protein DDB_G0283357-like [Tetranychus urticae]